MRTTPHSRSATTKPDVYQTITDQVVEMLEAGTAPWHQPWDTIGGIPMSMSSNKPYRGVNVLLLQMSAASKGYSSPWWGTYKQIGERGGQVRKGEKGTQVILWKPLIIADDANPGKSKHVFLLRQFTVFNAEQADGDLPAAEPRTQVDAINECEAALAAYYLTGPSLRFGGDKAFYRPSADHVQMPPRDQFHSAEQFYGTWFHETTHSTGHTSRLARKDLLESHSFGDESYSREELVAEMGAAFLAGITGIATATLAGSASYLASWARVLKGDKKLVIQAAAAAQRAVDMVLGLVPAVTEQASAVERATVDA